MKSRTAISACVSVLLVQIAVTHGQPAPAPEAKIAFIAQGSTGDEIISGLKITTSKNIVRVIQVKCIGTGSGALTREEQDCVAYVPADITPQDVRGVKIVFGNPVSKGGPDRNIVIVNGKVWFLGRNIWRSATDTTVDRVTSNTGGRLDSLRKGNLNWREGDMFSPPPTTSLWLEARGTSGTEFLTVKAKLTNGQWQGIPLRCTGTNSGQLKVNYQVCTGDFSGAATDVERLMLEFKDGPNSDVIVKDGRVLFFGVNVWWQANSPRQDAISGNVDNRLWKLRAGKVLWTGMQAPVDASEYNDDSDSMDLQRVV